MGAEGCEYAACTYRPQAYEAFDMFTTPVLPQNTTVSWSTQITLLTAPARITLKRSLARIAMAAQCSALTGMPAARQLTACRRIAHFFTLSHCVVPTCSSPGMFGCNSCVSLWNKDDVCALAASRHNSWLLTHRCTTATRLSTPDQRSGQQCMLEAPACSHHAPQQQGPQQPLPKRRPPPMNCML